MSEDSPDPASPLDRPDWDLEAQLREHGLIHYSTVLAMEGALLQARDQLAADIQHEVARSVERGEKPDTAAACRDWLRNIIDEQLRRFMAHLSDAGINPPSGM